MTIDPHAQPREPKDASAEVSPAALGLMRADMLRFANLQLGNKEAAEDMVQEAMESALRNLHGFSCRSSAKTWVFAILKNKIIDHLRQSRRTINFSSLTNGDDENGEVNLESLFNNRGGWRDGPRPVAWPSPDDAVQSKQFWIVFETCLDLLAPKAGKIFMMREFLGFESEEICSQLNLTTSNLYVILHRSRLKLRGCLETGWVRLGARPC
ncbi:MAG: sigma-70 family RNA polymerase sigma factor [Variovorax sp.]